MSQQYKTNFNSVGDPLETTFRFVDLVVFAFCVSVSVTFLVGALT